MVSTASSAGYSQGARADVVHNVDKTHPNPSQIYYEIVIMYRVL